jgi:hypothetical protein
MSTSSKPTLAVVLGLAIAGALDDVRVALPARVVSYDRAKQRASVQPLVKDGYFDSSGVRQVASLPILTDVPVMFQGSGDYWQTFPLSPGDTVMLVFASSSIDRWKSSGGEVDPADDRHHSLGDAVVWAGVRDFAHPIAGVPDAAMVINVPTELRLGAPDASELVAWQSALTALKTVFEDWTPVATDGGAALKVALTTLISGGWPKGATKIKAK